MLYREFKGRSNISQLMFICFTGRLGTQYKTVW